jgi:trimeric autotransporter adhesin
MAKTVDQFSTIENFRTKYNELAVDVGELSGLRTESTSNVVDALNSLEDKAFFFQEFKYSATSGQTVFSGNDSAGNSLVFRSGRIQVFKNATHLLLGTDYTIGGVNGNKHTEITLNVGASVSDVITVYAYTGSYLGSAIGTGGGTDGQFTETAANTIYNKNTNGVILNGSSTGRTTTLSTSAKIEFDSAGTGIYSQEDITLAAGKNFVGNLTGDVTGDLTGNVTGNLTGNVTGNTSGSAGTVTSISTHSASALSDINYTTTPSNGQILTWDNANQYWEPADNQSLSSLSGDTDDLTEGTTNLFSTTERIQDAAAQMITSAAHSNISVSYDDGLGTLTFTAGATYADSDARAAVSGGNGLAYNSSTGVFSANTSNGIEINSDSIELDYEIVNSAPASAGSTSTGHLWFVI